MTAKQDPADYYTHEGDYKLRETPDWDIRLWNYAERGKLEDYSFKKDFHITIYIYLKMIFSH